MDETHRSGYSLHTKILIGFVVGAIAGIVCYQLARTGTVDSRHLDGFIDNVTAPLGRIFLNLLFMVVVPIVFCSIALGVSQLGAGEKLGRLSARTFGVFVTTSAAASVLGLLLATVIAPGRGFDPTDQASLIDQYRDEAQQKLRLAEGERFWPDVVVGIISRNPLRDAVELNMLPIIFAAGLFGFALSRIPAEKAAPVNDVMEGVASATVVIVGLAMRLAPFAVPALIFNVTARFGWQIFEQLSLFVIVVLTGYIAQLFGANAVFVRLCAGVSPRLFFRKMSPVMLTALSTSSSSATLPTTIKVAEEELGIGRRIAGFVLPLGATMNMHGTALFVTVVVVFLAQVFGVTLGFQQQVILVVFAVLTAVGAAGVPSGSLPIIIVVLMHFGIPGEALALVLGVERILDMGRTVVNVTGDAAAACYVARSEGAALRTS